MLGTEISMHHLPDDTQEFMRRWRRKATQYDLNKLNDCFDAFFTSFVLFNFLYDLLYTQAPTDYPWERDREQATKTPKKFLGAETIANDVKIRNNAAALRGLVADGSFYIRESSWDAARLDKLASNDPEQWATGILEVIYQIRCNTFHGQKSFHEEQKQILVPCIHMLNRLNDMMLNKLAPNNASHLTGNPRRVPGR